MALYAFDVHLFRSGRDRSLSADLEAAGLLSTAPSSGEEGMWGSVPAFLSEGLVDGDVQQLEIMPEAKDAEAQWEKRPGSLSEWWWSAAEGVGLDLGLVVGGPGTDYVRVGAIDEDSVTTDALALLRREVPRHAHPLMFFGAPLADFGDRLMDNLPWFTRERRAAGLLCMLTDGTSLLDPAAVYDEMSLALQVASVRDR